MKKSFFVTVSALFLLSLSGCNDEIKVKDRSFSELCEISGGVLDQTKTNVCHCGKDIKNLDGDAFAKTVCPEGIVCVSNGEMCSNIYNIVMSGPCIETEGPKCGNDVDETGYVSKCINGEWQGNKCKTSCAENDCGECLNGATQCVDGIYRTCVNGKFNEGIACTSGLCDETGTYCLSCIFGETRCANGKIFTCQATGAWGEAVACESRACDEKGIACQRCEYGETKCSDGKITTCLENGAWSEAVQCKNSDVCVSDSLCGDCKAGASICVEGKFKTCVNGKWSDENECATKVCKADGVSCAGCIDGETQCEGGYYTVCENGSWKSSPCADSVSCQTEKECGVCKSGDKRCENGSISVCENGLWKETQKCLDEIGGVTSCEDSSCGECLNGSIKCFDSKTPSVCENGKWVKRESCNDDMICSSGKCIFNECNADEMSQCISDGSTNVGQLMTCVDGKWKNATKTCEKVGIGEVSCKENACGDCLNGMKKCEMKDGLAVLSTCLGGQFAETNCSYHACLEDGTDCVECEENEVKCETTTVMNSENEDVEKSVLKTCNRGKFEEQNCEFSCMDNTSCGECNEGDAKCMYDENSGKYAMFECHLNRYQVEKYCDYMCNATMDDCSECNDGDFKCENDSETKKGIQYICKNGHFIQDEQCPALCAANGKQCAVCEKGETRCKDLSKKVSVLISCVDGLMPYEEVNIDNYKTKYMDYTKSCQGYCKTDMSACAGMGGHNDYVNDENELCFRRYCPDGTCVYTYNSIPCSCNRTGNGYGQCINGWYLYETSEQVKEIDEKCVIKSNKICINGAWTDTKDEINCDGPCEINGNNARCKK